MPRHGGIGAVLDTPRTVVGDATFLHQPPDLDMSQEVTFLSPVKNGGNDLLAQLRAGGRSGLNLKTPRARAALGNRRNPSAAALGNEFTPLIKSGGARNTAGGRRYGKENDYGGASAVAAVAPPPMIPGLDRIDEDLTALPIVDASVLGRQESYIEDNTLPQLDASSALSTPMAIPSRRNLRGAASGRGDGGDILQNGNHLSLREQEDVIGRIEKENFALKLKIHFMEEALSKSKPGYNEAAIKENTELKVDRVTLQTELGKYKRMVTSAEKDLEDYRQQMVQWQERARRKGVDGSEAAAEAERAAQAAKEEAERLRRSLEDREADVDRLRQRVDEGGAERYDEMQRLRNEIGDLEAEVRERDRVLGDREDEVDDLKDKLRTAEDGSGDLRRRALEAERRASDAEDAARSSDSRIAELEARLAAAEEKDDAAVRRTAELEAKVETAEQRARESRTRAIELESRLVSNSELDEARDAVAELEREAGRMEAQLDETQRKLDVALADKARAEVDLEELQDEMANKSVAPKGVTRQREEKIGRLQAELEQAGLEFEELEKTHASVLAEVDELKSQARQGRRDAEAAERQRRQLKMELDDARADLARRDDDRNLLGARNETLAGRSAALQQDVARLEGTVHQLEDNVVRERERGLELERHVREQARVEFDRLNKEISALQAEMREKDNLYDNDSDQWQADRLALDASRQRAEERAAALQRTVDRLRERERELESGRASPSKEARLQDAMHAEAQRHRDEETHLKRRISDLEQALDARQVIVAELRSEMAGLRDEMRQRELVLSTQADKADALQDEVELLRATLDDETDQARRQVQEARQQRDDARLQLETLRRTAQITASVHQSPAPSRAAQAQAVAQLEKQLQDLTVQLLRANRERQAAQDKVALAAVETQTLKTVAVEAQATREELESQLRRSKQQQQQQQRVDTGAASAAAAVQERSDLRTAKIQLDNEVRRLRDENRAMAEQITALEELLEEAVARVEDGRGVAASSLSSASETRDLAAARRTIRDLERRIDELESDVTMAGLEPLNDGNSEASLIRRDLQSARQHELAFLQRESKHKETIRALKRQVADLERQAHAAEVMRLAASPETSGLDSVRKTEVFELRSQLATAQQSVGDLKTRLRDVDRQFTTAVRDLEARVGELEDEKVELQRDLEDAHRDVEDVTAAHAGAQRKLKARLGKLERERAALSASVSASQEQRAESRDLADALRGAQAEIGALQHDVCEQQSIIEALAATEGTLRRKLERTREERATFRLATERLGRDIEVLRERAGPVVVKKPSAVVFAGGVMSAMATPNSDRHVKELRGMVMQMEWMQARWEREAMLRADAAYAKKFLQLQLDIATAWYVYQRSGYILFEATYVLTKHPSATRPSCASSSTFASTFSATQARCRHRQQPSSVATHAMRHHQLPSSPLQPIRDHLHPHRRQPLGPQRCRRGRGSGRPSRPCASSCASAPPRSAGPGMKRPGCASRGLWKTCAGRGGLENHSQEVDDDDAIGVWGYEVVLWGGGGEFFVAGPVVYDRRSNYGGGWEGKGMGQRSGIQRRCMAGSCVMG
jgi:chromosome segregation ATPase